MPRSTKHLLARPEPEALEAQLLVGFQLLATSQSGHVYLADLSHEAERHAVLFRDFLGLTLWARLMCRSWTPGLEEGLAVMKSLLVEHKDRWQWLHAPHLGGTCAECERARREMAEDMNRDARRIDELEREAGIATGGAR